MARPASTLMLLFVLLLASPLSAAAAPDAGRLLQVDRILREAAEHGFGGALLVRRDGRLLIGRGYGYADREARRPFTLRTIAQIGSITKTFTAAAILQLAAAGRIDLAAPVRTYLPGAAEPAASRTIAELLSHHAGLMDTCGEDFVPLTRGALLRTCMARPLQFPVGSSHYSNFGYAILAAVIEAASGQDWETYLRTRIWSPLGMRATGFTFAPRSPGAFAYGYLDGRRADIVSHRIAALRGADWNLKGNGGIQASALDMDRFFAALTGGGASPLASIGAEMLHPPARMAEEGTAEGYGLFFRINAAGEVWRLGHSGSDGTFFSYAAWYPASRTFVYFVGNNGEREVRPVLAQVLATVQNALGIEG